MQKPNHIGIIMDGNRRWARKRGLPKDIGHKKGVDNLESVLDTILDEKIPFVTVYALSTENMKRDEKELNNLFKQIENFAKKNEEKLIKNGVKVSFLGKTWELPKKTQEILGNLKESTKYGKRLNLGIAINYGGKDEITRAIKKIEGEINEESISKNLDGSSFPNVDLVIRAGGHKRFSNFLIWKAAYAELYFTDTLWPDFSRSELIKSLEFFDSAKRNFGK